MSGMKGQYEHEMACGLDDDGATWAEYEAGLPPPDGDALGDAPSLAEVLAHDEEIALDAEARELVRRIGSEPDEGETDREGELNAVGWVEPRPAVHVGP